MDKLSELIQEAKPLYNKRKRQKAMAKVFLTLTLPVIIMGSVYEIYSQGNDIYVALENNNLQSELLNDDFDILER